MKPLKPIFYYHVQTGNRGDMAICKSITDAIKERINVPFAFFNVKYEELTEQRILNQVNTDGSALMIAGSGLYTNYPMSSGWYFPCKTELFNKIKVPIMLIGLGCNNNIGNDIFKGDLTDQAKHSIRIINDLASISTVRDQRTFDLLTNIGITKHKLMIDPGNFLRVQTVPKENRVAINIAQHSPSLGRFDGNKDERNKNIKYFFRLYHFLSCLKYKTVFIAHDSLEQSLIIDLKSQCKDMEYINTDNLDTMLYEYARCKLSVGIKMHSNIMSFAAGTPFISLYYDIKSTEYLKLINWSNYGFPVFSDYSDWLIDSTQIILANNKYYCDSFKQKKQLHQPEFDTLIQNICDIIQISN